MEWINIEDKKPDVGQKVITFFEITGIEIATYYTPKPNDSAPGIELFDCFENKSGFLCNDVTHWMPLPELPVKSKGGEMKEVYVLLADSDGNLRSIDEPWGVAVTTEEEAKQYVNKGGIGYTHSYSKLTVFETYEEAKEWRYGYLYKIDRKPKKENK